MASPQGVRQTDALEAQILQAGQSCIVAVCPDLRGVR
jgi:hypothetical protein